MTFFKEHYLTKKKQIQLVAKRDPLKKVSRPKMKKYIKAFDIDIELRRDLFTYILTINCDSRNKQLNELILW